MGTSWRSGYQGHVCLLPTCWLHPTSGSRALSVLHLCFPFPRVQVTFKNLASRPFSFHSTLQAYEETQDATQGGEVVQPGMIRKYTWKVLPQMAPTTQEFDCKAWAYFSNVDLVGGSLPHGTSQEGEMGSVHTF